MRKKNFKLVYPIEKNRIIIDILIFKDFIPLEAKALIDTGANHSSFCTHTALKFNLEPIGETTYSSSSERNIKTNIVRGKVALGQGSTKYIFKAALAETCNAGDNIDMIIGMDFLSKGSIKIKKGRFTFAFKG